MRFSLHGRRRTMRGLVGAVELEDWGGSIVPHEQTIPGPIEDRLRLMRAVRTNLSSIHAVFRGPSEPFASFLDRETTSEPAAFTTDEAGVEHRLWVSEPTPEVATSLEPESLMIADGHHRYSMALRYRDEMRASHGAGPWDRVMMFVADAAVHAPPVLPFHRIQMSGPFEPVGTRVRDLSEILETVSDERLVYGSMSLEDGIPVHRVAELSGSPPTVSALHEQVLRSADAELRYTPDPVEADDAVRAGEGVAILPPTNTTRIRDVSIASASQKSTFFHGRSARADATARPGRPDRVRRTQSATTGSSFLIPAATTSVRLRAPAPLR
jgi:hypothetical protein